MQEEKSNLPNGLTQTCEFGVWDKDKGALVPCGKPAKVRIESAVLDQYFCTEHYVDAIMQFQGTRDEPLPDDLERLIRKE